MDSSAAPEGSAQRSGFPVSGRLGGLWPRRTELDFQVAPYGFLSPPGLLQGQPRRPRTVARRRPSEGGSCYGSVPFTSTYKPYLATLPSLTTPGSLSSPALHPHLPVILQSSTTLHKSPACTSVCARASPVNSIGNSTGQAYS